MQGLGAWNRGAQGCPERAGAPALRGPSPAFPRRRALCLLTYQSALMFCEPGGVSTAFSGLPSPAPSEPCSLLTSSAHFVGLDFNGFHPHLTTYYPGNILTFTCTWKVNRENFSPFSPGICPRFRPLSSRGLCGPNLYLSALIT